MGEIFRPFLFFTRMTKSACSAFGFVKFLHLNPFGLFVAGNDHLANAFAVLNLEIFGRKVDEDYANFTAIVGIDSARPLRGRICAS